MYKKMVATAVIVSGIIGMSSATVLSDYMNKVTINIKLREENAILRSKLDRKKRELNSNKKKCKSEHIDKNPTKEKKSVKEPVEKISTESISRSTNKTREIQCETISTKTSTPIEMVLSFYGDLAEENGGYAGKDAQGNNLEVGTVASNIYPFGTQFELDGRTYTVKDRGGSNFNNSNRLDMFVPRLDGESVDDYKNRIASYGKKTVTMYKK